MRAIRSFGNRTTELRLKAILVRRSITGWKLTQKMLLATRTFTFLRNGLPFSSMDAFSTVVRAAATLRGLTEPIGQQK